MGSLYKKKLKKETVVPPQACLNNMLKTIQGMEPVLPKTLEEEGIKRM